MALHTSSRPLSTWVSPFTSTAQPPDSGSTSSSETPEVTVSDPPAGSASTRMELHSQPARSILTSVSNWPWAVLPALITWVSLSMFSSSVPDSADDRDDLRVGRHQALHLVDTRHGGGAFQP